MTSTNGNEAKRGADECSDDPAWSFVCPTRLPPEEFTYEVGGNGKTMTINDKHTVAKEYCYGITILDDQGVPHNSDDDRIVTTPPMIRNL